MQDGRKAVWSIPYVSVAFFPILKHNFFAYGSSKVYPRPDCIFEIYQLWQSGFSRVYSNWCYRCYFEAEIIKIGQSSHNVYSNNILNFQESKTILNACTKKVWKLIECTTYNTIIWDIFVFSIVFDRLLKRSFEMQLYFPVYKTHWRCPWCNGSRRRKWTRRHEFESWTRLIAFHIALIPLGKVWIQLISLQQWVNSRADCFSSALGRQLV